MAISEHITLTIKLNSTGIARQGFGIPLIISHNADFAERVRYYSSLSELINDGFASDSPEARAMDAMTEQQPHPPSVGVGRATGAVLQRYDIDISNVRNSTKYMLRIKGEGFDDATITSTSDGSATGDEIAADLITKINTVVDKNFTATLVPHASASDGVRVVGNAPGDWFSIEVVDPTLLSIAQTHADFDVDDDLTAILLEDSAWYAVIPLYNSKAYGKTVAQWAEANERTCYIDFNDTVAIQTAHVVGEDTDAPGALADLALKRTLIQWASAPAKMRSAALAGRLLPLSVGTWTAKYKTLSGQTPETLTSTQRTHLKSRFTNSYTREAGRDITWEGAVGNTEYKFFDVIVGLDFVSDEVSKAIFGVLAGADKIGYDDPDVARIEGAIRGSMKKCSSDDHPIFRRDPAPTVTVPLVADVDASDRADRILPGVQFSGEFDGAVHKVIVDGVVIF